MLPTSARVCPLTNSAVVATQYVDLCRRRNQQWCIGTFARGGGDNLPTGFHTVLWYPGKWKNGATYSYAVSCMLSALLSHHNWGASANESLYIMCNNLEDVRTLEHDDKLRQSHSLVRCDTVASSASTTAQVAAVIQRGGSFLSGSFTNLAWAEDCAGRSTVCFTRSISYTSLISPIFGMARVVGAHSYGVAHLTECPAPWEPTLI